MKVSIFSRDVKEDDNGWKDWYMIGEDGQEVTLVSLGNWYRSESEAVAKVREMFGYLVEIEVNG